MLNAMMLTIGVTLLATVASFFAGMAFRAWQVRRREAAQLRIPVPWPLEARPLVNTGEEQVWDWLRHTFYDHLIMVKVPVLRFTIPLNRERYRSAKWLDMLGEVYTTFTVCTTEGVVIGCVDVPGKRGMSQANQDLKDALLSDCNISYTVLRPTRLPQPEAMRMAFLGEAPDSLATQPLPILHNSDEFTDEIVAFNRERALDKQRAVRENAQREIKKHTQDAVNSNFGGLRSRGQDSQFPSQWENSFISELDSRKLPLR